MSISDFFGSEIDYDQLPDENILCVDMKSFYASIECSRRGLDPFTTCLAVVGDRSRRGSVVLAATPRVKEKYNLGTGSRLYEIPENSEIKVVEGRMGVYLRVSTALTRLFTEFVPFEAIQVYSIDESWLQLDNSFERLGDSWETARQIRQALREKFDLPCSMGLGPNMFLSKVAMDIEGKKRGLVEWRYEDVPDKLWPIPLEECWGIGHKLAQKFRQGGVKTVGDLARLSRSYLEQRFGIMGSQLYYHARGIDLSRVRDKFTHQPRNLGKGITLFKDYTDPREIKTVIFDLSEQAAHRAREYNLIGKTVSLGITYSHRELEKGFYRQRTRPEYTNLTGDIYETCVELFAENYEGQAVRRVRVTLGNFVKDSSLRLNLFAPGKINQVELGQIKDELEKKFGPRALFFARSLLGGGVRERIKKTIGGQRR